MEEKKEEVKKEERMSDKEMNGRDMMWRKHYFVSKILLCFLFLIIVFGVIGIICAAIFHRGHKLGRKVAFERGSMMENRSLGGGFGHRGMMGRGFYGVRLSGTVTVINGNNITVKDSNNKEYTVVVSDSTSYVKSGDIAKQSDLAVNNSVVVSGSSDSQGQITATVIRIK